MGFEEQRQALQEIINELHQRWAAIQVLGRQLTADEERESAAIEQALALLHEADQVLGETEPLQTIDLRDGRYQGGNGEIAVELRLDEEVCGIISGDIFRFEGGHRTWVASFRTEPAEELASADGVWEIVAEDNEGRTTIGSLALEVQTEVPLTMVGSLLLDEPVAGVPGQVEISFTATHSSEALRSLGIELEREQTVAAIGSCELDGQTMTIQTALANAGLETYNVGATSTVAAPPNQRGWGTAELHALMVDHAQASLAGPAWEVHLLVLDKATRDGLLGIMFDSSDLLPRQGSAVFAGTIRQLFADDADRRLIRTAVHEIGHALNLAHRYERVVGRADSLSFMNYDWRYRGGGHEEEYWSRFAFTFDPDELAFLRHGPRHAVIPGGRAFHTIEYWAEGGGGYVPYSPEVVMDELELTLTGPANGLVFDFLQPVFLQVELTNRSGTTLSLSDWLLDAKAGALEVVVTRISGGQGESELFMPMMQRCIDLAGLTADEVPHGGSIRRNLNLTFGAAGFTFAEPGEYEVQAVVCLADRNQEQVVPSNRLRIRIAYPKTRSEEEDALVLLRDDVGLYLALGGSRVLDRAADDLEELRARRQGKTKTIRDGLSAAIVRCAGIDRGRSYLRRQNGAQRIDTGDSAAAADLLERLDRPALRFFDADTARATQALAKTHRSRASS